MRLSFLSLVLMFVISSCGNGENAATNVESNVDALKKEVIHIHDEVMPKMGLLGKLANELNASEAALGEDSVKVKNGARALIEAKDGMMTWMHEFKNLDEENWTDAEKIAYLEKEKVKIGEIKTKTDEAITTAKEILGNQ